MIRVSLFQEEAGYTGFEAKGHAGYAEHGSDIVCAAVSVLGCTCINSLESVCGVTPIVTANTDGLLAFVLPPLSDASQAHDAQILMAALKQGLEDISSQYPRYVTLCIQKRRDRS